MSAWPTVPLGQVLRHRKEFVAIDDLATYKRCRVQLHAAGIVLRDSVAGAEIKTKTQQVCRAGEFLVAEIDAKHGGYGIVPDDLDGAIVSSHYFLFTIDPGKLDRQFLAYYYWTPAFHEQVAAQGTTNYAAIRPHHVLEYTIPLPPLAEQQRLVGRIEAVAAKVAEATRLRDDAQQGLTTALQQGWQAAFSSPDARSVGDLVRLQSGYAFKSEWFTNEGIRLVRNVNIGHGEVVWQQTARIPMERREEFSRFELKEGDILITLDRPLIATGVKVARVRKADLPSLLLQRVARVNFVGDDLDPDYFFAWLHSPHFANGIDPGRSNGVPHISPKDVEKLTIPIPSRREQRAVVTRLSAISERAKALQRMQMDSAAELAALLPAVLDRAFRGEL
ncbi:MAG TPA: restriction endonuclease subunit S [Gemmataceae bacterium]|jgi:type I restriction enzyme S subunit